MAGDDIPRWRPTSGEESQPRLRELADIVGHGTSLADDVLGAKAAPDAWAAITSTVDGLPCQNTRGSMAPDSSRSRSRPEYGEEEDNKIQLDSPVGEQPLNINYTTPQDTKFILLGDHSLKARVTVVSAKSLNWTRTVRPALSCAAAVAFCSASSSFGPPPWASWQSGVKGSSANRERSSSTLQERNEASEAVEAGHYTFARSLLHFRHPSTAIMSVVSSQWQALFSTRATASGLRLPKEIGEVHSVAVARVEAWHNAFRSLFYGYRYQQASEFYVVLSSTVVLFTRAAFQEDAIGKNADTVGRSLDVIAIVSNATKGFVSFLEEYDVSFTRHALKQMEGDSGPDAALDIYDDVIDRRSSVPLSVQRGVNVHALFNLLLEYGPTLGNATDVPILISDYPFVGGQLVSCVVRNPRKMKTVDGSEKHDVQIEGILTPQQFSRLCQAMQEIQSVGISIHVNTDEKCHGINFAVDRLAPNIRMVANEGRVDKESWIVPLGSRVISQVVFEGEKNTPLVYTKPENLNSS